VVLVAFGADEMQIEVSFCEAIRNVRLCFWAKTERKSGRERRFPSKADQPATGEAQGRPILQGVRAQLALV